MSDIRRSSRIAQKRAKTTKTNGEDKERSNISSKGSNVGHDNDDKKSIEESSNADSRKKYSEKKSIHDEKSNRSKRSARSTKIQRELMIQADIKKKELEQELLRKQQDILDLQLAFQLSRMGCVSSDGEEDESIEESGSVVSNVIGLDVQKWIDEQTCLNEGKVPTHTKPCCSKVCNSFSPLFHSEIYSTPKFERNQSQVDKREILKRPKPQFGNHHCQIDNHDIRKILTRQSVPKELPVFSGDPTEWPNFIYQYKNSTALCGYSKEENQSRLQKCLKGNAKKITQALLILPQNVDKVIELLENRFGRPEHIILLLLDRLRKLPTIKEEKLEMLIEFSDELKNFISTIQSLEEYEHLCNPLLLQELLNKLPTSYKMRWVEYITGRTVENKLVEFGSWLDSKANAASQLQIPQISDSSKSYKEKLKNKDIILATKFVNKKCICCQKNIHNLSTCSVFKSFNVDERWSFVRTNRICFSCLLPYHGLKDCRRRKVCKIDGCQKVHHDLLHNDFVDKGTRKTNSNSEEDREIETNCHILSSRRVLLKILPVIISNGREKVFTHALLDDASTVTLIDEDLANQLHLQGPRKPLCIQWTNNQTKEQDDSRIVTFEISSQSSIDSSFYLRHVRTIKGLSLPRQTVNIDEICSDYPYIDKKIESMMDVQPKILIGQDNWPLLVGRKTISGPWHGPVLSKTLLGWVVHGNFGHGMNESSENSVCFINSIEKDELDILHDMVKEQWKLESFGTVKRPMSREDMRAQNILDSTMRRVGNKFETGLLWKGDNLVLPNSKNNALKRLFCVERRMDKDRQFGQMYCEKMDDMLKKNYISEITDGEEANTNGKVWYLPHFGVVNPNKPNKLRIVFDASSKSNGVSLNDFLLPGPDLYNSLQTILLNFRIRKYAFSADIKEMFLQINVRKEDRMAQRILYRGMHRDIKPKVFELNVVFFGSSSGPCLAQEAKNRNAKDFQQQYPEAVKAIIEDHYMDDYLGGADSLDQATQLIKDIIHVHSKGGFTICNWISNDSTILGDIDEALLADCHKNLEVDSSEERILGVWWDPRRDIFCFKTKFHKIDKDLLEGRRRPTKREVLKVVMSVFDPLGFLANFLIQGKIILQNTWRSQIGWDDEIPDSLNIRWEKFIEDLKHICEFKLPRQYCTMERTNSDIQLHIFCDASENAYASVAYLRWKGKDGIQVCFLTAKTRVSPLKPLSIPRLELQAALMGARLGSTLKKSLDIQITETFHWTDSKTVLYWIRSEARRFKAFVSQRLEEIQELTNIFEWRYVGSKQNVADEATKQQPMIDFSINSRWFSGPKFLKEHPDLWPIEEKTQKVENKEEMEIRNDSVLLQIEIYNSVEIVTTDPDRFSKWQRLLRSTAWIYRFLENCKTNKKKKGELEISEINRAENELLKKCQQDSFQKEISSIRKGEKLNKKSRLYSLDCFLDQEDLIRLGGRLNNSLQLDEYEKRPIILDKKHKITRLIVQFYHENSNHHGQEIVLNNLRRKFWILRMRQAVRSCWANCQLCRNKKSFPKPPIMGQLPICRLEPTVRPFIKTGIDYFGPIEVTVKRSHEKRYGVIFTCMVTRAVHLEIANDLSTNGFIHVFRQFGCRRGFPEEVYSDNGGNFKGAEKELRENLEKLDQNEIMKMCSLKKVKWFFNPPLAPFMGGVWESLIKSIKKNMFEVLKSKYPKEYVLRTVFAEVENIMNSRPLTHVSTDPDDPEALTPNHFLIGTSYSARPCTETNEKDLNLLEKWKAAQKITDMYWHRWAREYLPSLVRRSKWHQGQENIKVGDIVLLYDPNSPRNVWPKGRVSEVYPAKDGKIRVVDIITNHGTKLRRAVSNICILDVTGKHNFDF